MTIRQRGKIRNFNSLRNINSIENKKVTKKSKFGSINNFQQIERLHQSQNKDQSAISFLTQKHKNSEISQNLESYKNGTTADSSSLKSNYNRSLSLNKNFNQYPKNSSKRSISLKKRPKNFRKNNFMRPISEHASLSSIREASNISRQRNCSGKIRRKGRIEVKRKNRYVSNNFKNNEDPEFTVKKSKIKIFDLRTRREEAGFSRNRKRRRPEVSKGYSISCFQSINAMDKGKRVRDVDLLKEVYRKVKSSSVRRVNTIGKRMASTLPKLG